MSKITKEEMESVIACFLADRPGRLTADVAKHVGLSDGGVRHYLNTLESDGVIKSKDGGFGHWTQYRWYIVSDYEARRAAPFKALNEYLRAETQRVISEKYGVNRDKENDQYWGGQFDALIAVEKEVYALMKFIGDGDKE